LLKKLQQNMSCFMPSNNFANERGNFTLSDQALAGRNRAMTLGWSFDDWKALHNAANGLQYEGIPSGSPEASTYQYWFSQSGLFLYTNP
jgi:hypothetical protein